MSFTGCDYYSAGPSEGLLVFLNLDKAPVAGEPISFTVKVMNKQRVNKMIRVNLNAQAKKYNHRPTEDIKTFWETHGVIQLAPMEGTFTRHSFTVFHL